MFNSGVKDKPQRTFKIAENGKEIRVFPSDQYSAVLFSLIGNVIKVIDIETNNTAFDISIGLNDEGECRFVVDGKEGDSWQVRRKALEGIFFRA